MTRALIFALAAGLAATSPGLAQKGPGTAPPAASPPSAGQASSSNPAAELQRLNAAGEAAMARRDYEAAADAFDGALAIYVQHAGINDPRTGLAASNLGQALLGTGEYADALELFQNAETILRNTGSDEATLAPLRRAQELARRGIQTGSLSTGSDAPSGSRQSAPATSSGAAPGSGSADPVLARNEAAVAAFQSGDFETAEAGFLEVLRLSEAAGNADSELAGIAWINLGEVYTQTDRLGEAENAIERGRTVFEALDPAHRYLAVADNNLAAVRRRQGGAGAALDSYRAAAERMEQSFGADHPNTAAAIGNVASALLSLGRAGEALPLLERAYAIEVEALGEGSSEGADTVSGLGQAYLDLGLYDRAIDFQRRAVAAYETADYQNPQHRALMRQRLGRALDLGGRPVEAEVVLLQAVAEAETAFGAREPDTIAAVLHLASAIFNQARYAEAEALQRRALADAVATADPEGPDYLVASIQSNLAGTLRMLGEYEEAERLYRSSLATAEAGDTPVSIAISSENLAGLLRLQGRLEEAATLQAQALALWREALGETHPEAIRAMANAGTTLGLAGEYEDAERLMQDGLDGLLARVPEEHITVLVARVNLAWLYLRHMDRPRDALPLYRDATRTIISSALDARRFQEAAEDAQLRRRSDIFELQMEAAWATAHEE